MKKLTNKRKRWLDSHAKTTHRKELKRGLKWDRTTFVDYSQQSDSSKRRLDYQTSKNKYDVLIPPKNFSLFSNPEKVLSFFSNIMTDVRWGNPVYFDMKPITNLSIDAIMYFLAILQGLKYKGARYNFRGSSPSDKRCRHLLESSGFFSYVQSKSRVDLKHDTEVVQIASGSRTEPSVVKDLCDFSMAKLKLDRRQIKKLYLILIELMTNTKHHAYKNRAFGRAITNWYTFVEYVERKNSIRFIFLDTGEGIPSTIRKKVSERVRNLIGLQSQTDYIISALNGDFEFRSSTGKHYRGKGLPKINSFYKEKYIKDLTIISNQGYFSERTNNDLRNKLSGALFYWELYRN